MREWKMHDMENERMENARHEKGRKCTYQKMTEKHTWKMKEWKMHDMENGRNKQLMRPNIKCIKCHNTKYAKADIHCILSVPFYRYP